MKNKFKKKTFIIMFIMLLGLFVTLGAQEVYYYNKVQEVFDWGTGTTKVVVNVEKILSSADVNWSTFEVYVKRYDKRLKSLFLEEGQRKVTDAYVSDEMGNKVKEGNYIAIVMETRPGLSICSPLNYISGIGGNNWAEEEYTIKQVKEITAAEEKINGIVSTTLNKTFRPQIDKFTFGSEFYRDERNGDITLTYAAYEPEIKTASKSPLIIWLHGAGEGGKDPTIPLAANKSVNFASEEVQKIFGGAYVLVPQTPTVWMDPGAEEYDYNIEIPSNIPPIPSVSKYTKALKNLIDKFVQANPGIDTNRIYIGGCSAGGFMTMRMILDYPDYFAAAFPVCEGFYHPYLTDKDIEKLKNQNIWFVTAATDSTLPAPIFTLPTYDKLIKEGAKNVHLTYLKRVIDTSGRYRDEKGNPYEYNGHYSWIYVYNNEATAEIDGQEIAILNWLAMQNKLY
ncbi:MAG TPA: prolyl oligopeptidase family serine peptidase [Defluviitoga sp.]|nr:prolyl oligopeptidase family serine peptidase [Defluviitoga sp.]HPZ29282.1 prolyl oligopeptidase family serine peptidase [Defluviitoga sp.]HQD63192.1 prolyl oligopeptidase family serine peptidase [Defluviitoga sp.]